MRRPWLRKDYRAVVETVMAENLVDEVAEEAILSQLPGEVSEPEPEYIHVYQAGMYGYDTAVSDTSDTELVLDLRTK